MRVVEVEGSYFEMGFAQGRMVGELVRGITDARWALLEEMAAPDGLKELAREHVERLGNYWPEALEELRGAAEGAGIEPERLLAASGYTDFRDAARAGGEARSCTLFHVPPGRWGGGAFAGQTWDMDPSGEAHAILLSVEGKLLTLTLAGCPAMMGVSAAGVAVFVNDLRPRDARVGVTWVYVVRRALEARSLDEARRIIEEAPLSSGHNYLVCDAERAFDIERTATRSAAREIQEPFAHSNHYTEEALAGLAFKRPEPDSSTVVRLERARELVGKAASPEEFLRDHANAPKSICNHGKQACTCAACYVDFEAKAFKALVGRPCEGTFEPCALEGWA